MGPVLFRGRQRQDGNPSRRPGSGHVRPVDLGPVAGRKGGSHRAKCFFRRICRVVCIPLKGRNWRPMLPIMGQNDRRSPIMNPALLLRALTVGLMAIVMVNPPVGAQTLDKVSFGTNWVPEAE